jgi:UDP:flavonoid glycosyltransferase YjiC (YdhE family)
MGIIRYRIVIVGPAVSRISGSSLRALNIWYSLRGFSRIQVEYLQVDKVAMILPYLKTILSADLAIVSGVNPWIAAIIAFLRSLNARRTLVDFHGFSYMEALYMHSRNLYRLLLLVSEYIAYRLATHVMVASPWLARILRDYFGDRDIQVVENTVSFLFQHIVKRLMKMPKDILVPIACKTISEDICKYKVILVSPLPDIFTANILAYKQLKSLKGNLDRDILIIISGIRGTNKPSPDNIIVTGYLPYTSYILLLSISYGILLPYPNTAICGGARNKVLEAGYICIPLYSTKTGVLHLPLKPWEHYIPVDNLENSRDLLRNPKGTMVSSIALNLCRIIERRYVFENFKKSLLAYLLRLLRGTKV